MPGLRENHAASLGGRAGCPSAEVGHSDVQPTVPDSPPSAEEEKRDL